VTTAAGQKLADAEPTMACREWSGLKQVVIPDGMYFVAGDNRGNSLDSRIFGPVSKSQIHAKVLAQMRFTWGPIDVEPIGLRHARRRVPGAEKADRPIKFTTFRFQGKAEFAHRPQSFHMCARFARPLS
jgi:hypothetical protein